MLQHASLKRYIVHCLLLAKQEWCNSLTLSHTFNFHNVIATCVIKMAEASGRVSLLASTLYYMYFLALLLWLFLKTQPTDEPYATVAMSYLCHVSWTCRVCKLQMILEVHGCKSWVTNSLILLHLFRYTNNCKHYLPYDITCIWYYVLGDCVHSIKLTIWDRFKTKLEAFMREVGKFHYHILFSSRVIKASTSLKWMCT